MTAVELDLTVPGRVQATASAERGQVVAVIGPNGAGKSTLLRAVAGLVPAVGELRVDGRVVESRSPCGTGRWGWRSRTSCFSPTSPRWRTSPSDRGPRAPPATPRVVLAQDVARPVRGRRPRRAQAPPAVRRPGAARLDRAGLGHRPAAAAPRRAVRRARHRRRRQPPGRARPPPRGVRRRHAAGHPRRDRRAHPGRRRLGARRRAGSSQVGAAARRGRPAPTDTSPAWSGSTCCTDGDRFLSFGPSSVTVSPAEPGRVGPAPVARNRDQPGAARHAVRLLVSGEHDLLADVTPAAVAELELAPGSRGLAVGEGDGAAQLPGRAERCHPPPRHVSLWRSAEAQIRITPWRRRAPATRRKDSPRGVAPDRGDLEPCIRAVASVKSANIVMEQP